MAKKVALGKGLKALLPNADQEDAAEQPAEGEGASGRLYHFQEKGRIAGRIIELDVENIRPNPYQPRHNFDEEALDELAASIQQLGIIQPVTVRSLNDGQFEIISGERRLRASRRAGLDRIPAFVREADSEEMLEMAIVENVQREELNPMEVALGYQRLIEECKLTQENVAQKVGKKRATVANFLRLLKLPPRLQAALRDNAISMGHARALINVDDEQVQLDILEAIQDQGLSVRDVENRVRRWQEEKDSGKKDDKKAPEAGADPFAAEPDRDMLLIKNLEGRLRGRFSTQVHIKHKKGDEGGRIEIEYYSNEDLERLMELLVHD